MKEELVRKWTSGKQEARKRTPMLWIRWNRPGGVRGADEFYTGTPGQTMRKKTDAGNTQSAKGK